MVPCAPFATSTGAPVPINIHPSNVVITKLASYKDRKAILARKDRSKKDKGTSFWRNTAHRLVTTCLLTLLLLPLPLLLLLLCVAGKIVESELD